MTTDDLTITTVIDAARRRGVVFVTTTDDVGTLTIRWQPPRSLTADERRVLLAAGATALANLINES